MFSLIWFTLEIFMQLGFCRNLFSWIIIKYQDILSRFNENSYIDDNVVRLCNLRKTQITGFVWEIQTTAECVNCQEKHTLRRMLKIQIKLYKISWNSMPCEIRKLHVWNFILSTNMSLLNIRTALTMVKDILKTLHFLYKLYFFPLLEEACGKN